MLKEDGERGCKRCLHPLSPFRGKRRPSNLGVTPYGFAPRLLPPLRGYSQALSGLLLGFDVDDYLVDIV